MTKVICPCTECVHNGDHYICNAEKVEFIYRNMATVNEGRVDMWKCKQYELSEIARKIDEGFSEYIKQKIDEGFSEYIKKYTKGGDER